MDYYKVLGIDKGASDSEIKSAYRKKALEWHPDKNKSPEAEKKFKEINQAFEVLSNPQKKQAYDQFGHEAFTKQGFGSASRGQRGSTYQQGPFTYTYSTSGGGGNPFEGFDVGGFSDPFEIFEQFFGGGSPFGQQARRSPLYQIEITFDEAVKGVEKKVTIDGKSKTIKIPAGVDSGMRIRFADFSVIVQVRPSTTYKRRGQDLYIELDVPFTKALLGDTIKVPTIDDKDVTLKVRPGTQPGTIIRLREKGMPYPRQSRRGDQYVVLNIQFPDKLSKKQKELIEELDKEMKHS